jgi:hypothetical protein
MHIKEKTQSTKLLNASHIWFGNNKLLKIKIHVDMRIIKIISF